MPQGHLQHSCLQLAICGDVDLGRVLQIVLLERTFCPIPSCAPVQEDWDPPSKELVKWIKKIEEQNDFRSGHLGKRKNLRALTKPESHGSVRAQHCYMYIYLTDEAGIGLLYVWWRIKKDFSPSWRLCRKVVSSSGEGRTPFSQKIGILLTKAWGEEEKLLLLPVQSRNFCRAACECVHVITNEGVVSPKVKNDFLVGVCRLKLVDFCCVR